MDPNAYRMLDEVYRLVNNEQRVLTANQINYIAGVLKTMLTLYKEDAPEPPIPNIVSGARRPPSRVPKKSWWEKIVS